MPVLGAQRPVEFELPSSTDDDKAIVTLNMNLLTSQTERLSKATSDFDGTIDLLSELILKWNLTDAAGEAAPITPDNIRLMNAVDFKFLSTKVRATLDADNAQPAVPTDEKKD